MTRRGERLFVGVDGGTGDMEAVLVDGRGGIRGRGTSGPSNDPAIVGRMHPRVGDHVVAAIRAALEQGGARPDQVEAVSLNLSGDPTELRRERAEQWLAPLGLPAETVLAVDQDGLSAWAAGGFPDPAIWVLLGTNCGSEGMLDGSRVAHPLARLDLDAHLGRPVGGAAMGTWALAAAVQSRLGGQPTRLYEAFLEALGVSDTDGLVAWANEHSTSDERGELFRSLAEVGKAGDQVAVRLLRFAGESIAEATRALARYMRVGTAERPVTVLLAGKAWRAGGVLRTTFEQHLRGVVPGAAIRDTAVAQVEGAALLAMRHAGLRSGPELFTRLQRSPRRPQSPAADAPPGGKPSGG
ncbi:MAG: hypothetical protein M3336_05885 [Chloroflexota bacterium]|nr:hypothetical protein [Chloroflexota bacterium]